MSKIYIWPVVKNEQFASLVWTIILIDHVYSSYKPASLSSELGTGIAPQKGSSYQAPAECSE